ARAAAWGVPVLGYSSRMLRAMPAGQREFAGDRRLEHGAGELSRASRLFAATATLASRSAVEVGLARGKTPMPSASAAGAVAAVLWRTRDPAARAGRCRLPVRAATLLLPPRHLPLAVVAIRRAVAAADGRSGIAVARDRRIDADTTETAAVHAGTPVGHL